MKKRFAKAGFATQTDAAYWAVRVLERHLWIAKALVKRFPEIVIDEAQDTSQAQMRIIDLLVDAGLEEVVLIGDPDQAIYEWRTAHPELFEAKQAAPGWQRESRLTRNMRSSQAICNATHPFSTLSVPAIGQDDGRRPTVWFYDEEHADALVPRFTSFCKSVGVEPSPATTALLVRGRTLLRRILALPDQFDPWPEGNSATRLLALASWHRDLGRPKDVRRALESAALSLLDAPSKTARLEDVVGDARDSAIVSAALQRLANRLPTASSTLRNWVAATREVVRNWAVSTGWPFPNHIEHRIGVKKYRAEKRKKGQKRTHETDFLDWPLTVFFDVPASPDPITVETIHAAKGKTYIAVLLALSGHHPCTPKQLTESSPGTEEVRTAYVAMTRPRSVLVVAVPSKTKADHLAKFGAFEIDSP